MDLSSQQEYLQEMLQERQNAVHDIQEATFRLESIEKLIDDALKIYEEMKEQQ